MEQVFEFPNSKNRSQNLSMFKTEPIVWDLNPLFLIFSHRQKVVHQNSGLVKVIANKSCGELSQSLQCNVKHAKNCNLKD